MILFAIAQTVATDLGSWDGELLEKM